MPITSLMCINFFLGGVGGGNGDTMYMCEVGIEFLNIILVRLQSYIMVITEAQHVFLF